MKIARGRWTRVIAPYTMLSAVTLGGGGVRLGRCYWAGPRLGQYMLAVASNFGMTLACRTIMAALGARRWGFVCP